MFALERVHAPVSITAPVKLEAQVSHAPFQLAMESIPHHQVSAQERVFAPPPTTAPVKQETVV